MHQVEDAKPSVALDREGGQEGEGEVTSGALFMWRLSKHQQTISIEVESGELVPFRIEIPTPLRAGNIIFGRMRCFPLFFSLSATFSCSALRMSSIPAATASHDALCTVS